MNAYVIICLVLLYWGIGTALYVHYSRHDNYMNMLKFTFFMWLWPLTLPCYVAALMSALICAIVATKKGEDF